MQPQFSIYGATDDLRSGRDRLTYIKSIVKLIGLRPTRHLFYIYVMTSLSAIIEMSGAVIAAYSILPEIPKDLIWITNRSEFEILLIILIICFLALLLRLLATHYEKYLANLYRINLAEELIEGLWSGPYQNLSQKNNSELVKYLNTDADMLVGYAIDPIINVGSAITSVFVVTTFLFLYDPINTFIVITGIATYFILYGLFSRKALQGLGTKAEEMLRLRQLHSQQLFSDIRSFKSKPIDTKYFVNLHKANKGLSWYASFSNDLATLPRFLLETVITGVLVFVLLTTESNNSSSTLSTLIVYGIAGLRLLPSCQKLFVAYANLNYSKTFVLEFLKLTNYKNKKIVDPKYINCSFLEIKNCIIEKPNGTLLRVPHFQLKEGEIIALTGASGSGKTTFVDTIIGLHDKYNGNYMIDDQPKTEASFVSTSYLTQKPNLPSGTISEIFCGGDKSNLNLHSMLDRVNLSSMTDKTYVGENARNISGGELQRLAVIKGLYEACSLRILDESFNAISEDARHDVFNLIKDCAKNEMVIVITHDENIKKLCDREYQIINDELTAVG